MGVHRTKLVCKLMTGVCPDATQDCEFQFIVPILAHVDDTNDTMKTWTVYGLYLRPTRSTVRGIYAFDINNCVEVSHHNAPH